MTEPADILEIVREMIRLLYKNNSLPQFIGETLDKDGVLMVLIGEDVKLSYAMDSALDKESRNVRLYKEISTLLESQILPLMSKVSIKSGYGMATPEPEN